MLTKTTLVLSMLALFLMGCTSKELYHVTQGQARINCDTKVGVERDECLGALNKKSYEDYEKERQDMMKEK